MSLSDYNRLREILGLSSVSISNNEFLVHCDTWNYVDDIQQRLEQQSKITLNGQTLTAAETWRKWTCRMYLPVQLASHERRKCFLPYRTGSSVLLAECYPVSEFGVETPDPQLKD